jgi:plasmid stabilization system protein ParE
MAGSKSTLTVIVSPTATAELAHIWRWNAACYSPDHADRYVDSLKRVIVGLARTYSLGKSIGIRPDLRYVLIRRKPKGHGHLVIYRFDEKTVDVLHIFHTAQDWQTKLID